MNSARKTMQTDSLGPMKILIDASSEEIKQLDSSDKHWVAKGRRTIAVAITLLQQNKIIAIPTDTVYGFAGVVYNASSIKNLYEIKGRNENKPLCISVSSVNEIGKWGVTDDLPPSLLPSILPGPYTIVLKRTPLLNPLLNPGIDTVGIRVPQFSFVNKISKVIGPLALTSANISNEPSCLDPLEFQKLWPQLGGIFYGMKNKTHRILRKGSTIVDLSHPNHFKIVRSGIGEISLIKILRSFGLQLYNSD